MSKSSALCLAAMLLLKCASLQGQDTDASRTEKVYPETIAKDIVIDAPWRVESADSPIPFVLAIKDANFIASGIQELKLWRMAIETEAGGGPWIYTHDFGSIPVTADYFTSYAEGESADFFQYDTNGDGKICPAELGFTLGDTIHIKAYLIYREMGAGSDDIFEKHLKIIVGQALPNIAGDWYYGDAHYHTFFTRSNIYEFGGDIKMTVEAAKAIGLSWVTTTDHTAVYGDLQNYLSDNTWPDLKTELDFWNSQLTDFHFIQGEEMYVDGGPPAIQRHFLVHNNSNYVDNHDFDLTRILADVTSQSSAFSYVAHPLDGGDFSTFWTSQHLETALQYPSFVGLEVWNTRIDGIYEGADFQESYQNPFNWDVSSPAIQDWRDQLTSGISFWDSLLIAQLSSSIPRKIFISGGSDAHGDFNYTVKGLTDITATRNAFGKVRTATYCPNGMGADGENAIAALRNGKTVVTDGPLIAFGIDTNLNGQIDPGIEPQIGDQWEVDIAHPIRLIAHWESTLDFGAVDDIRIRVGYPSLGGGITTEPIDHGVTVDGLSGLLSVQLDTELKNRKISGWCFLRLEAYTDTDEFRCYTNPVWLYVTEGQIAYNGPVWHVATWGDDNVGNGSTSKPFATIQAAINAASDTDTVRVHTGIYRGPGNRDILFGGKSVVVESANGRTATVIDCEGTSDEWHRAFDLVGVIPSTVAIRGLTIRKGYHEHGGGIRVKNGSSVELADCALVGNASSRGGGAIAIFGTECDVQITECDFDHNSSSYGGAIYKAALDGAMSLGDSRFYQCDALQGGAACIIMTSGENEISNCVFTHNAADYGSALMLGGAIDSRTTVAKMNIYGSLFSENIARSDAAIHIFPGDASATNINGCTVTQNEGGLASIYALSDLKMINSIVAFNSTHGLLLASTDISVDLQCCDIYGNWSDWNPAIEDQFGLSGNISRNPLFCNFEGSNYHLMQESPCSDLANSCNEQIGAFGVGCGTCCVGKRGNSNYDSGEIIDIMDLTYLVLYMFKDGEPPSCSTEADLDATGVVDIVDLTYLVSYMFKDGSPPMDCTP